ncbi:21417_t:CDS:2 [Racocetra persica]|uniref:21417_t:CDS:1 n=1 Tax=Racocetra persica TaxID=160502 RepID=A0ACA9P4X8_9GLOM|nr:21417_t:CDS:2 [Racocetra persica]
MSDKHEKNDHNLLNETEEIADETEIDLESFFEEAYYGSVDMEDLCINIETVILEVENNFDDFDQAKQYVKLYAEFKDFKIRIGQNSAIDNAEGEKVQHKKTICCRHSGQYHLANKAKSRNTVRQGCQYSNTSLYELDKVLMDISEDRVRRQQCKDPIRLTVNSVTIFSKIKALVKRYLHSNIIQFLINQIKESIFYTAHHSNINEVENMLKNESSESDNFNDEYDSIYMYAYFFLQHLNRADINEIPQEFCEDIAIESTYFEQRFIDSTENMMNKSVGLVYNAIDKCLLYNDTEFVNIIKNYIANMHKKEVELVQVQQANQKGIIDLDGSNKENILLSASFKNLLKVATKKRLKLSSYRNNDKCNQPPTHETDKQKHN